MHYSGQIDISSKGFFDCIDIIRRVESVLHENARERIPRSLLRGKRANRNSFLTFGRFHAACSGELQSGIKDGPASVFVTGSTASVTTIEYESGVVEDLKEAIERLAPSDITYRHDTRWGDGNGFSHVRAALLKPGLTIPVINGGLALGTWQQIVLIDFDNRPCTGRMVVQIVGDR